MDLLEGESLRRFGQRMWSPYVSRASASISVADPISDTEDIPQSGETVASPRREPYSGLALTSEHPPAAAGELRKVLHLLRRICATLAFLHGEGFVNCDLKPENVLIVNGQPVIIDFGLTAHHPGGSGREALEAQRSMSGTLPYMSPEQIRGEFPDARSDLYAVGCVLYELLTGGPPFAGAPRSIVSQHLSAAAAPPSGRVSDIPPRLEQVVLKLLEKDVRARFGYADEVATALAEIAGDVARLADFPPARPYLYRSRFVGRADVTSQLGVLRDRAAAGSGAFVLVAGESGVGKTRLAMELTRVEPAGRMRIVTSEASGLAPENAGTAPLQVLRPLLQAIADRCQEGGAETTDRLLGGRRSVLALYEPLLAQVPSAEPLAAPIPLPVEAARKRLFKYLAETLAEFAHDRPVLALLDDVGWADELSVDFLQSLTPEYLESTPLFLLGTYRSEEATETISALLRQPHITHVILPRLPHDAVASMIDDMLALPERRDGFVEFVTLQAEGNPFFVTEHVRTAVAERVLYRDQNNLWQLREAPTSADESYRGLPLPRSLRELIEHRLRNLTPAAQQVGLAAAVLGHEVQAPVLHVVADISESATVSAVDELLRRQVLDQPEPGRLRFAHDKLREVAYSQASSDRLTALHARAATALEALWKDQPEPSRFWATLGRHFSAGSLPETAIKYLQLAADHARSTYANGDAIRLYREAIAQSHRLPQSNAGAFLPLSEALADVLALVGRRDEARATYTDILGRLEGQDPTHRARIYRKLGKTWETQHQHESASEFYARALDALGPDPVHVSAAQGDEWIRVQIDQLWLHYWRGQVDAMKVLVATLRPFVTSRASAAQRARFLQVQILFNLRRDRYVVTEETLEFARDAAAACQGPSELAELPMAQFTYGLALLLHTSLQPAHAALQVALSLAKRAGDIAQQARCLTYLTVGARMRNCVPEAADLAQRSAEMSLASGMRDYVAAARANEAWVALRSHDPTVAKERALEALGIWRELTLVYPLQWLAVLPLIEVELDAGRVDTAVGFARSLLAAEQQPLPGAAADDFRSAQRTWDAGDVSAASSALRAALSRLSSTVYH
jgi:tetratricopeptide (TPR) repeat protein